jgi:AcrR family transcriptional regulator
MSIRDDRREAAIERMADHLLREGLEGATLRAFAAAVGTSDRMLLYYFIDKDELLAATLERVAFRMVGLLNAAMPTSEPQTSPVLLQQVWAASREPALAPFMRLWVELAAGAACGREPYRRVAGAIADGFQIWLAGRLTAEGQRGEKGRSAALLASIEGLLLLDAVGRRNLAEAAVTELCSEPVG